MPMCVTIDAQAAAAMQCVASSADAIDIAALAKLDAITCNLLYNTVKAICQTHGLVVNLENEDTAHQSWSVICETFLHT